MPKSLYIDPVAVRQPGYIHFNDIPVCQYNKTVKQELEEGNYTKEDLIRIYRDMAICREFEHMLTQIKTQANYNGVETTYPGPAHLSYGQEASCVGEAYLLNKDDITFGSHRSHSEILSKGLSCINKLSDEELMEIMQNFLGGKTLAAVKKFADTSDVKELAIRFVLYGALAELFARLLQEDMPTLQKYEKRLTALEEALMQDQAQDLDKKLFRIRRELSVFAAYYEQLDDLFAALSDETEESDAHASRLFDRLTGRAQRLLSATELEKEYALQLREMHQTQLDMRQNQIMKILTIVTTVFLPLSLIAGWYGMNFVNMPELTAQHGYLAVCIISVVCIIVELVIFKWKKWL